MSILTKKHTIFTNPVLGASALIGLLGVISIGMVMSTDYFLVEPQIMFPIFTGIISIGLASLTYSLFKKQGIVDESTANDYLKTVLPSYIFLFAGYMAMLQTTVSVINIRLDPSKEVSKKYTVIKKFQEIKYTRRSRYTVYRLELVGTVNGERLNYTLPKGLEQYTMFKEGDICELTTKQGFFGNYPYYTNVKRIQKPIIKYINKTVKTQNINQETPKPEVPKPETPEQVSTEQVNTEQEDVIVEYRNDMPYIIRRKK